MQAVSERIYLSPRARATILWIAAAAVLFFLWQVSSILTPFVWAIVTAYVLNPVVSFLARRTGWPRRLWTVILFLGFLGLLAWSLGNLAPLLAHQVNQLSREIPSHFREAGKLLGQTEINILGVRIDLNAPDAEISRQIMLIVGQFGRDVLPGAIPRVAEGMLKLLVYLVATFFLLLEADRIGSAISRLTPSNARSELTPWVRRINEVLGAYIRGQLFLVLLISTVTYIGLTILDVRFAPLIAIFSGLVETMPFIGPYIAGGTAVLIALTQGTAPFGWSPFMLAIAVAIMYTIIRQLEDNFVMPLLIGRLTHLHPLVVIFVVLAGATLAGVLGLLIAVPMAATIKIIVTYLYEKFQEQPPRAVVMVGAGDSWEDIAARIREGAIMSKGQGAARPRLLISVPVAPALLLDPAQFDRLPALLQESKSDAVILTPDPALAKLATASGIPCEARFESETQPTIEPPFEEPQVTGPLGRRLKGEPMARLRRGTKKVQPPRPETGKDLPA